MLFKIIGANLKQNSFWCCYQTWGGKCKCVAHKPFVSETTFCSISACKSVGGFKF